MYGKIAQTKHELSKLFLPLKLENKKIK